MGRVKCVQTDSRSVRATFTDVNGLTTDKKSEPETACLLIRENLEINQGIEMETKPPSHPM